VVALKFWFVPQTEWLADDGVVVPLGNNPSFVPQTKWLTGDGVVVPLGNDPSLVSKRE
jgi:hypothetical protein